MSTEGCELEGAGGSGARHKKRDRVNMERNISKEPTAEAHDAYSLGDGETREKENPARAKGKIGENGILKPTK